MLEVTGKIFDIRKYYFIRTLLFYRKTFKFKYFHQVGPKNKGVLNEEKREICCPVFGSNKRKIEKKKAEGRKKNEKREKKKRK